MGVGKLQGMHELYQLLTSQVRKCLRSEQHEQVQGGDGRIVKCSFEQFVTDSAGAVSVLISAHGAVCNTWHLSFREAAAVVVQATVDVLCICKKQN